MNKALRGFWSLVLAVVFFAGLVAFGLGADHLDSARTDELTAYKACADARTAGVAVAKLPSICDGVTKTPVAQTKAEKLLGAYTSCLESAVQTPPTPTTVCDGIKAALDAAK